MTRTLSFDPVTLPPEAEAMRSRVRAFIRREIDAGTFEPGLGPGLNRHSPEFSRKCGAEGFIGMTWPKAYGGHEHSFLERYVVTEELLAVGKQATEPIGQDPETDLPVYVKTGRFGPYVQLGDPDPEDKKKKPKMVSLLKGMAPESMTLAMALKLLELPRLLGLDAEGKEVRAYLGRYGPYIKRDADSRSLGPDDDLMTIQLERALELLAQEKTRGRRATAEPLKVFEKVEALDGADIKLLKGRYGPYVTDGETNASLPRTIEDPLTLTLAHALELLEARRNAPKRKKKAKKKAAKKKTAKKKAAKKKSAKKKATKKKT